MTTPNVDLIIHRTKQDIYKVLQNSQLSLSVMMLIVKDCATELAKEQEMLIQKALIQEEQEAAKEQSKEVKQDAKKK